MMIKIMKKTILVLLFFLFLFRFLGTPALAQEKVTIYFFWSKACPHCAKEKVFLEKLVEKYPQVELRELDVGRQENVKLWREACERLDAQIGYTPFTVIGTRYFVGFLDDETTGLKIENALNLAIDKGCTNILSEHDGSVPCPDEKKSVDIPETIEIPIVKKSLRIRNLSLPILTIVLGILDGFNPCAMWTLLFLISLLLGMENKKRMWILGSTFVVTSAFVYFLIMSAWLNFFLLLGMVIWIRLLIGLVALGAGGYNLREFWLNKDGGCKVTGGEKRRKVFERIKNITHRQSFLLALGGIILLALAVNVVELVCSAGLPAVFTQVLALNNLASWKYYLYIAVYIFFFMVDDLFVFFAAMITMHMTGISTKYSRYSNLIGGILMFVLGILLIFKPGWLMFG